MQRGVGYFVTKNAIEKILALRKEIFFENELPIFFKTIKLLGIDIGDLSKMYKKQYTD